MHSMPRHHQEVYVQAGTFESSIWPTTIFDSDFESKIIANIGTQCPTTRKCMLLGETLCARKAFCAKASPCKNKCTSRVHSEIWVQLNYFFTKPTKHKFHLRYPIESGSYRIEESRYFH